MIWEEAKKKLKEYVEFHNIPLEKIVLSFSGGKDSTILLYLIKELGWIDKIHIVFSNTGMEFDAIYEFINQLKQEGINIEEVKPKTALPLIYLKYGIPIHSKYTSEMLYRLQYHNFDFINDTFKEYDELIKKYPHCKSALTWLCGTNIKLNCPHWLKKQLKYLTFKVSNKCCDLLKKKPFQQVVKKYKPQLMILGIRKAEGGIRTVAYKGCIHQTKTYTKFFPLFHWSDEEVWEIIKEHNIPISKAYTEYGSIRTGCVGCPFAKDYKKELEILKEYEPNKYNYSVSTYANVWKIYEKRK